MHLISKLGSATMACVLAGMFTSSATLAQPLEPLPSAVDPLPITENSYPFNGAAHQVEPIDLTAYNFLEEEFLVSGTAQVYDWKANGDYQTTPLGESPYTTRIVVRRPADMADFSGRVVVEVINMSAGYDWTAMWAALWERIVANGDIYVGITSKPNVFPGLVAFDAERYGRLEMPNPIPAAEQECGKMPGDADFDANLSKETENGLIWDMLTQLGALLKSNDPGNPLGEPAQRVFFTGESQSGRYGLTYFRFFQPDATITRNGESEPIYDAFLLEAANPRPVPIHQCATPLAEDDPQSVIPGRGVPIAMINSQWDFFAGRGAERKPDANTEDDKSVSWELAGSNHGWRWQYLYGDADHADLRKAGLLSDDAEWVAWSCGDDNPEVPLYMAEKALYEHVIDWVETGQAPPSASPIEMTAEGEVAYDADNTARGGLRMPMVSVPVAAFGEGRSTLKDGCPEIVPFGAEKLKQLYGTRDAYLEAYHRSVWNLVQQGFLLSEDVESLISTAEAVPFQ